MKKAITTTLILVSALVFQSCKTKVAPISERIAKIWTANSVSENSIVVYKLGATTNTKPGYATYRMDLSTAPNVVIKEVDGGSYTGKYTIVGDKTLSITGLVPEPTGTGGSLSFTISTISDTELILTADQSYAKTGNTKNVYTLKTGV